MSNYSVVKWSNIFSTYLALVVLYKKVLREIRLSPIDCEIFTKNRQQKILNISRHCDQLRHCDPTRQHEVPLSPLSPAGFSHHVGRPGSLVSYLAGECD